MVGVRDMRRKGEKKMRTYDFGAVKTAAELAALADAAGANLMGWSATALSLGGVGVGHGPED